MIIVVALCGWDRTSEIFNEEVFIMKNNFPYVLLTFAGLFLASCVASASMQQKHSFLFSNTGGDKLYVQLFLHENQFEQMVGPSDKLCLPWGKDASAVVSYFDANNDRHVAYKGAPVADAKWACSNTAPLGFTCIQSIKKCNYDASEHSTAKISHN